MKKSLKVTWLARTAAVLGGLGIVLQAPNALASEADLKLPDLHSVPFLGGGEPVHQLRDKCAGNRSAGND